MTNAENLAKDEMITYQFHFGAPSEQEGEAPAEVRP